MWGPAGETSSITSPVGIAIPPGAPYDCLVSRQVHQRVGCRALRGTLPVLAVALAACSAGQARSPFDGPASSGPAEDQIRVEVQNLNFNDATIWALRASQRVRVGRVSGKSTQVFTIRWNVAQPIGFEVDVVSARTCRTGQVVVNANSRVWVTIPSDMGFGVCRAGRR